MGVHCYGCHADAWGRVESVRTKDQARVGRTLLSASQQCLKHFGIRKIPTRQDRRIRPSERRETQERPVRFSGLSSATLRCIDLRDSRAASCPRRSAVVSMCSWLFGGQYYPTPRTSRCSVHIELWLFRKRCNPLQQPCETRSRAAGNPTIHGTGFLRRWRTASPSYGVQRGVGCSRRLRRSPAHRLLDSLR